VTNPKQFSRAVASKRRGILHVLSAAPEWIELIVEKLAGQAVNQILYVAISSDTAEAKLRKHPELGDLETFLDLIHLSLDGSDIEVRESKQPRSFEVYLWKSDQLWLVAYKVTIINEILISTAHRVRSRHLNKSRTRALLHGIEL
jgi:hypothetical protein